MNIKITFFYFLLVFTLLYGCSCKDDQWGDELILVLPTNTSPTKDTFSIGDTLWIKVQIDKNVEAYNSQSTIYLDEFDFFIDLGISEISGDEENYNPDVDVFSKIGSLTKLVLPTATIYTVDYLETKTDYQLLAGIKLNSQGKFYFSFSVLADQFKSVDHPILYKCKNQRRSTVTTYFNNQSTTVQSFKNIFLSSPIDYFHDVYTYELYEQLGAHSFVVK